MTTPAHQLCIMSLKMFDYNNFDDVFAFNPSYSYDLSVIERIDANRRKLEGFFVNKVLKALDIKRPAKLYPPKTNSDLKTLHQAITAGNGADYIKLGALYYLLLDCDAHAKDRKYSDVFEEVSLLSRGHQICMKGLWHMDRLEFEMAVQYLTHPSLIPTYPEDVLEKLIQYSKNDDFSLALSYYYTVHPTLQVPRAIESLYLAIAKTSVTEALYFSRLQTYFSRRKMFEMLISLVLHSPPGEKTAARGIELVNLPLDQEEEQWFELFLTKGEGRGLKRAKDTVMMRRVGTGKFSAALSLDFGGAKISSGLSWAMVQDALQEGLGPRVDTDGVRGFPMW